MNQQVATRAVDTVTQLKNQVAKREADFKMALPAHIPVERFMRVINTAVTGNSELLKADRVSLFEAAMKAAQDGLLPDGRDGALVIFAGKVQWMPMIGGILKKVRNSGELLSISAYVAYSNDLFEYSLGDEEHIKHIPELDNRGKPRLVYAIAKTKDGGIYREVMTVAEIEKVRAVSRAGKSGPWVQWWDEMARKTVLRRLAKRLPMSSDLDDLVRRDDALYEFDGARGKGGDAASVAAPSGLAARLDALAGAPERATTHDAETGEIIDHSETDAPDAASDATQAAAAPDGERPLGDTGTAAADSIDDLLADGRANALDGRRIFDAWHAGLSDDQRAALTPHMSELMRAAKMADEAARKRGAA